MPAPRRRNQFADKSAFAVFALIGAAIIIGCKFSGVNPAIATGIPVALILVYALLTASRWTRFRLRYDQAGDNCYYLGFIYTLVSLGVALYEVSSSDRQTQIIQDFGVALATTLVGVTLRVILHQVREDPIDVEEAARLELGHSARRVAAQLGSTLSDVVSFRVRTQDELKQFAFETKQVAEEYRATVSTFKEQAGLIGTGVESLVEKIRQIEVPSDLLDRKLAPAAAAIESLAVRARALADTEDSRLRSMSELAERTRDAVRETQSAIESLRDFAALPERMAKVFEQMTATTAALEKLQERSGKLAESLIVASDRIDVALRRTNPAAGGRSLLAPAWNWLRRRRRPRIQR